MTCAKRRVSCRIRHRATGREVWGYNSCDNPQVFCPRVGGEGYGKCKLVCQQRWHAEEGALLLAEEQGLPLEECEAWVYGIDKICGNCMRLMGNAGIAVCHVCP